MTTRRTAPFDIEPAKALLCIVGLYKYVFASITKDSFPEED